MQRLLKKNNQREKLKIEMKRKNRTGDDGLRWNAPLPVLHKSSVQTQTLGMQGPFFPPTVLLTAGPSAHPSSTVYEYVDCDKALVVHAFL